MIQKTPELLEIENRLVVAKGGMGEGGQKMQTSKYEISKFWGCNNVQHGDYSQKYSFYIWKFLRELILNVLITRKKKRKKTM